MSIRELRITNIRLYALRAIELSPHVTLLLGKNGSGKTTLLESLYYLLQGTSFKGRDRDMINHAATSAQLLAVDTNGDERRASLTVHGDNLKLLKAFTINGRTSSRLPSKQRLPVVLFEPDELRLLSSSPQRRRQFFDGILGRLDAHYTTALNRYQRILMQRNELLKQFSTTNKAAWEAHLFTWDIKFAEFADQLVHARNEFAEQSNERVSQLYSALSGTPHTIATVYQSVPSTKNYEQNLLRLLSNTRQADIANGHTVCGPHRDDFLVMLDGHPASETASRGEMRTIMLAYKLLEIELQQAVYGTAPLILMDDVFSELDSARERQLMDALKGYQTIITATDLRDELKIDASVINLSE